MENNKIAIIVTSFVLMCVVIFGGITLTRNIGKSTKTVNKEDAITHLNKMVKEIEPEAGQVYSSAVEYSDVDTTAQELPPIDTCPVNVDADSELYVEIYATSEKAGTGTDGWLCDMAKSFNDADYAINGIPVSVQIRCVSSGTAMDYIRTGIAVPDGYSPSNELWVSMLNSYGFETETITDSLVKNVAGIVIKNDINKKIIDEYGSIDLKTITEAVTDNKLTMGYTNPFTSASGLNFLVCTLQRYDDSNLLSETAQNGFSSFQNNIPFVSLTTTQMRTAADNGTLDGFIMEYQTYINDSVLSKNYTFTPYGYRHDNPLVIPKNLSSDKKEIIKMFADFCKSADNQKIATDMGFNSFSDYICEYSSVSGDELVAAQKFYKENKNNGQSVACVFIADVSGSMEGDAITALQDSLINSMQYINSDNYIGLVSYSSDVTIEVPLAKFDLTQQSKFKGSIEHLSAGGSTATFDAICVGLDMLEKQLEQDPNVKPLLFVLSDGETNVGYSLKESSVVIEGLKIPVYTIGYNADLDALKSISAITEAATIDASNDDIVYQLKQMFNAEL